MSTHKITPETKVPFPCWLLVAHTSFAPWWKFFTRDEFDDAYFNGKRLGEDYTHYSTNPPDQQPQEVPDQGDGPGEEDGPWAKDWEKRSSDPTPAAPSLQSVAEAAANDLHASLADVNELVARDTRDYFRKLIADHFAPLLAQHEQRVRELEQQLEPIQSVDSWAAVCRERDALRTEVDRFKRANTRLKKNEAICHCGSPVSMHGMGDGHSPVEMQELCPYAEELFALRTRCTELEEDKKDLVYYVEFMRKQNVHVDFEQIRAARTKETTP